MRNLRADAIHLLLPPVLFYLCVKLSLAFAVTEDSIVMLWLPNGVLLATLLRYGFTHYGGFAVGILLAEIAADYPTFPLSQAIAFGIINLTEATTTYVILRRLRFNPSFAEPADLVKFVIAGPFIAALGAAFAAGGIYVLHDGHVTTYLNFVRVWWFSDGLGLLIVTPLLLSFWSKPRGTHAISQFRWYDAVIIVLGVTLVLMFLHSMNGLFYGVPLRAMVLIPFALYAAARTDLRWTSCIIVGLSMLALYVASEGRHPFGPLPIQATLIAAQEFILTMSLMSLGLNTLLSQQRAQRYELEERVAARTAELTAANVKLEKLALTDALTGLPNRRALLAQLNAEIGRQQRQYQGCAVVMFDIDHFKRVNDRFGHATGDAVLREVAQRASAVIRDMDSLGRYGGEEFILIAPGVDLDNAVALAERLRACLRSSEIRLEHQSVRVTASFGVAMLEPSDVTAERLLQRADVALYAAKEAGRDRVVVHGQPVCSRSPVL